MNDCKRGANFENGCKLQLVIIFIEKYVCVENNIELHASVYIIRSHNIVKGDEVQHKFTKSTQRNRILNYKAKHAITCH